MSAGRFASVTIYRGSAKRLDVASKTTRGEMLGRTTSVLRAPVHYVELAADTDIAAVGPVPALCGAPVRHLEQRTDANLGMCRDCVKLLAAV